MLSMGRGIEFVDFMGVREQVLQTLVKIFPSYDVSLAIAGGGCKAFYALGVGKTLREWGVRFTELSGVSAGAAMALCILSQTEEESVEYFEEITKRNSRNFHFSNFLRGESTFPHEDMYRRTIRFGMKFDKVLESGAKIWIHSVKAHPKEDSLKNKFRLARLISETGRAFILDDRDRSEGIPANRTAEMIKKWNMEDVDFTEKDFVNSETIEQFIMNSSSIPPIVDFQSVGNEYYLDGGLTNNMFIEAFSSKAKIIGIHYEHNTIVGKDPELLAKSYLITPSKPLPITSFDYTNPKGVRETYELGKADALAQKTAIIDYLRKD
ncbi:patatin-like phospholipase family protein [Leptospira congkakensis]|uniref:Patatin-like phospholipase family protein n=1 Tax=Leptospira congkakensis TaxID=2484932 RepID=A0A4Z1A799_9LEPT|nr:patatin-like phospholipase family protein [Leptospira congkakensis]TGL86801.1 patatin-like phospholipase family protein [Leptospira congkakensis]TGL93655.1 patatin-like phospholipase family protein [Leptospira congkakensis]TGL94938.1 patatin-like phospholipase family protein [Leptospira congkakensis]